jgi:hypothetical protein
MKGGLAANQRKWRYLGKPENNAVAAASYSRKPGGPSKPLRSIEKPGEMKISCSASNQRRRKRQSDVCRQRSQLVSAKSANAAENWRQRRKWRKEACQLAAARRKRRKSLSPKKYQLAAMAKAASMKENAMRKQAYEKRWLALAAVAS